MAVKQVLKGAEFFYSSSIKKCSII